MIDYKKEFQRFPVYKNELFTETNVQKLLTSN